MDDGEVLPRLNEPWTFMGAKAMEWMVGVVVFLSIGSFMSPAKAMPFMLGGWLVTTMTLAKLRDKYPDEERGLRNALLTSLGIAPPDIPAPAAIQPVWSPCRVMELPEDCKFKQLELEALFPSFQRELEDADDF